MKKTSRLCYTGMAHVVFAQGRQVSCLPAFAIAPAIILVYYVCPKDYYQCISSMIVFMMANNCKMYMSLIDLRNRKKIRAPCHYTESERKILEPFKEIYRSESNRDVRKQIWRSNILAGMFNYWTNNGTVGMREEEFDKRVTVSVAGCHVALTVNYDIPGTGKVGCKQLATLLDGEGRERYHEDHLYRCPMEGQER